MPSYVTVGHSSEHGFKFDSFDPAPIDSEITEKTAVGRVVVILLFRDVRCHHRCNISDRVPALFLLNLEVK
jgi:hypothetical protein